MGLLMPRLVWSVVLVVGGEADVGGVLGWGRFEVVPGGVWVWDPVLRDGVRVGERFEYGTEFLYRNGWWRVRAPEDEIVGDGIEAGDVLRFLVDWWGTNVWIPAHPGNNGYLTIPTGDGWTIQPAPSEAQWARFNARPTTPENVYEPLAETVATVTAPDIDGELHRHVVCDISGRLDADTGSVAADRWPYRYRPEGWPYPAEYGDRLSYDELHVWATWAPVPVEGFGESPRWQFYTPGSGDTTRTTTWAAAYAEHCNPDILAEHAAKRLASDRGLNLQALVDRHTVVLHIIPPGDTYSPALANGTLNLPHPDDNTPAGDITMLEDQMFTDLAQPLDPSPAPRVEFGGGDPFVFTLNDGQWTSPQGATLDEWINELRSKFDHAKTRAERTTLHIDTEWFTTPLSDIPPGGPLPGFWGFTTWVGTAPLDAQAFVSWITDGVDLGPNADAVALINHAAVILGNHHGTTIEQLDQAHRIDLTIAGQPLPDRLGPLTFAAARHIAASLDEALTRHDRAPAAEPPSRWRTIPYDQYGDPNLTDIDVAAGWQRAGGWMLTVYVPGLAEPLEWFAQRLPKDATNDDLAAYVHQELNAWARTDPDATLNAGTFAVHVTASRPIGPVHLEPDTTIRCDATWGLQPGEWYVVAHIPGHDNTPAVIIVDDETGQGALLNSGIRAHLAFLFDTPHYHLEIHDRHNHRMFHEEHGWTDITRTADVRDWKSKPRPDLSGVPYDPTLSQPQRRWFERFRRRSS